MSNKIRLKKFKVPLKELRWRCPSTHFKFKDTSNLEPLKEFIGQERALDSINFGLDVDSQGYNLFLTGLTGTGKATTIKSCVEKFVNDKRSHGINFQPCDWCYVHNFTDPDRPRILKLSKGCGKSFKNHMEWLLKTLQVEIPKAFTSEEVQNRKQEILEAKQKEYREVLHVLDMEAKKDGLMVELSMSGSTVVPLADGKPLSREDFLSLKDEEREAIETKRRLMMKKVDATARLVSGLEKEADIKLNKMGKRVAEFVITGPFTELFEVYGEYLEVRNFLNEVKEFVLTKLQLFFKPTKNSSQEVTFPIQTDPFIVFKVNVLVDNSCSQGPPIVIESNPSWFNMFGKIERKAVMGAYISDHTMIKPGSLQLANGGYLILNVRDVLFSPGVWDGLKRAIKTKEVRLEDPLEQFGFLVPQGIRPQPVPLNVKIVMTGEERIYQLLALYEEDFWEMFKVKADFNNKVKRTDENLVCYAQFLRKCCDSEKLLPFDRAGVAKVMEYASRAVSDQEKLSSRFGQLKDLAIEADYWAKKSESRMITGTHVDMAVKKKIHRLDLVAENIRQLISEGTLMVDVEGSVVGQVNGLAVYDFGIFSFGFPSRITAKTFLGKRGVINIERESKLSGRIHDKGVLILSGYLGSKFAQDKPLSLTASLCFEQTYTGVDGDSASSTELYAVLSSLADIPIKQYIAVTGSVNQQGEIQPIGGVNQKIEGFFDVCKEKGLTGEQGVLIPARNIRNLMLREDVTQAVKKGQFHIYKINSINEGIEILTGLSAGTQRKDNTYPKGTVNYLVNKRLIELAEGYKGFHTSIVE